MPRIVLIRPCCIGDVLQATAALQALRRHYPAAHITWAVGGWSKAAIADHDLLDAVLDTGEAANPAAGIAGLWRMVRWLRAGGFDVAVSLVRSPWMSLAVLLSGISTRAGIDSGGRGFGYNLKANVDPRVPRHEAEIYLDVVRLLGAETTGCTVNVPVNVPNPLDDVASPYVVLNPTGGNNPGMTMDSKRWPPASFAALGDALVVRFGVRLVLVGGPGDMPILEAVKASLRHPAQIFAGDLTFGQIATLAHESCCYIGNDTGLTHLAAAAGAKTVMILGPSDPVRYAPFASDTLALWRPYTLSGGGVADDAPVDFDWSRHGIGADEVIAQVSTFMECFTSS